MIDLKEFVTVKNRAAEIVASMECLSKMLELSNQKTQILVGTGVRSAQVEVYGHGLNVIPLVKGAIEKRITELGDEMHTLFQSSRDACDP